MSNLIIIILKFYKNHISPVFEVFFGKACRFTPTCSEYTIQSVEKYGTVKGLYLGFIRVLNCNPFTKIK